MHEKQKTATRAIKENEDLNKKGYPFSEKSLYVMCKEKDNVSIEQWMCKAQSGQQVRII